MERAEGKGIFCGSGEREPLLAHGEWRVYRCRRCGPSILDPRPDAGERVGRCSLGRSFAVVARKSAEREGGAS